MEALLIIFAEIIFACLAPLLGAVGAVFGVLFEAIALALGGLFGSAAGSASSSNKRKKKRKPLISRRVLHWSAGVLGGVGVLTFLASIVFFDPLLRMVLTRAGDRGGIALSYEGSAGSLMSGRVALANLEMQRDSDDSLAFALNADRIEADIDLWSLLSSEPRIEFALVEGLSGSITPPEAGREASDTPTGLPRKRRPFRADRVSVQSVDLQITPRRGEPYRLEIDQGEVAPFRSRMALFDLLFRSNLSARIADQPLRVATREISDSGRQTTWDFDQIEADRLKVIVRKAPLTWLNGGTVTVKVEDSWNLADDEINMDWHIALSEVELSAPVGAGRGERLLAGAVQKLVAAQGGDATFQYRLNLSPEETRALREGDLAGFWDKVLSGIVPVNVDASEGDASEQDASASEEGRVDKAIGTLRELLKRGDDD